MSVLGHKVPPHLPYGWVLGYFRKNKAAEECLQTADILLPSPCFTTTVWIKNWMWSRVSKVLTQKTEGMYLKDGVTPFAK